MSSDRRPWYPWYPRDFNQDEKVKCLSDDAELLYRRALDVMWQANTLQLPSNCYMLANALARGWQEERFKKAWNEVQTPGFELLKTTENGEYIYSARLLKEAKKIEELSNKRKGYGKIGGVAKAKQKPSKSQAKAIANGKHEFSHTDTDTDIKERKRKKLFQPPSLQEVKTYFIENGYSELAAEKAFRYYEAGTPPWHDSKGTPVKSWKQKMQAVWFKDENKVKSGIKTNTNFFGGYRVYDPETDK